MGGGLGGLNEPLDPATLAYVQSQMTPDAEMRRKQREASVDTGVLENRGNAGSIQAMPGIDTAESQMTGRNTSGQAPVPLSMNPTASPGPADPLAGRFDWRGLADYLNGARHQDLVSGLDFGSKYFGTGNPQIAEIERTRRSRAMGLNGDEIQAMRETASSGINSELAAGLRANRATAAANGVRGGAAVGANAAVLARANDSRANAERAIALADMQRRGEELNRYEGTVTNERAGLLGTGLGFANQGAQDRYGAMQYGLGQDYMDSYRAAAGATPNMNDGAWNAGKAMDAWREGGYKPGQDPIADWLRKNVYDVEGAFGVNPKKWTPQTVLTGNSK